MTKIALHYASEGDLPQVFEVERALTKIVGDLKKYSIEIDRRCGSAHKTPRHLSETVVPETHDYDIRGVILGRQPALGPALDATTQEPVITYLTDAKDNPGQFQSSLNVPSGVGCMTAPPWAESMALALLKIAGVQNKEIKSAIKAYQETNAGKVTSADMEYKGLTTEEAAKKLDDNKRKKEEKK